LEDIVENIEIKNQDKMLDILERSQEGLSDMLDQLKTKLKTKQGERHPRKPWFIARNVLLGFGLKPLSEKMAS